MKRNAKIRRNFKYIALHGLYWMYWCACNNYLSVFLLDKGYTSSVIGFLIAAGFIISLILQPIVASIADRSRRFTPTAILSICFGISLVLEILRLCLPKNSFALSAVCVLSIAMLQTILPIINAYASYLERLGQPIRFGVARGVGSITFSALSTAMGYLTAMHGTAFIPGAAAFFLLLLLGLMVLMAREGSVPSALPAERMQSSLTLRQIAQKYRSLLFLLGGVCAMFTAHAYADNFFIQIVEDVGGTSADMGILFAYGAMLEVPFMFGFGWFHKRRSCTWLLKLAAVFFVAKGLCLSLATGLPMLYLAQTCEAPSYGLFASASVCYITEIMAQEDQNKGQSLVTVMIAVGCILSSLFGGVLIDTVSVRGASITCTVLAAIGMLLILLGMHEPKKETIS